MATNLQAMRAGNNTGTAVAHPVKDKLTMLDRKKDLLGAGASESVKVDREIRAAAIMLSNSKDLQESTPETFYTAVSNAINSGIGLCNGRGYLVAYKGKCSFVPGWKGLIDLVARTGRATAWTGVVYKGDKFDYELGGDPFLRHKPEGDSDNWSQATHVYAIGRIKDQDFPIIECWTIAKVIKHLNKFNKVGGRHYALKDDNNMEMYARKIVLLQAMKYLPSSQDLDKAVAAETASERGQELVIDQNFVYVPSDDDQQSYDEPAQQAQPAAQSAPVQQQQHHQQQGTVDERSAVEKLADRLSTIGDVEVLDLESDFIQSVAGSDEEEQMLQQAYRTRREQLTSKGGAAAQPAAPAAPAAAEKQAAPAGRRARGAMSVD